MTKKLSDAQERLLVNAYQREDRFENEGIPFFSVGPARWKYDEIINDGYIRSRQSTADALVPEYLERRENPLAEYRFAYALTDAGREAARALLDEPQEGDLRVWWDRNFEHMNYFPVATPDEAVEKLRYLADVDLKDSRVEMNAGGLEVYEDGDWTEWHDPELGGDIDEYMEELDNAAQSEPQEGDLRVWWTLNIMPSNEHISVDTPANAVTKIKAMDDDHSEHDGGFVAGLEVYQDGQWHEWKDGQGYDIDKYVFAPEPTPQPDTLDTRALRVETQLHDDDWLSLNIYWSDRRKVTVEFMKPSSGEWHTGFGYPSISNLTPDEIDMLADAMKLAASIARKGADWVIAHQEFLSKPEVIDCPADGAEYESEPVPHDRAEENLPDLVED